MPSTYAISTLHNRKSPEHNNFYIYIIGSTDIIRYHKKIYASINVAAIINITSHQENIVICTSPAMETLSIIYHLKTWRAIAPPTTMQASISSYRSLQVILLWNAEWILSCMQMSNYPLAWPTFIFFTLLLGGHKCLGVLQSLAILPILSHMSNLIWLWNWGKDMNLLTFLLLLIEFNLHSISLWPKLLHE